MKKTKKPKLKSLALMLAKNYCKITLMAGLPLISTQIFAHDVDLDNNTYQSQSRDEAINEDIDLLAKEKGVSTLEIEEALEYQQKFKEFFNQLHKKYPNKIARVWLEPAPSQEAYIEFVDKAPSIRNHLNINILEGGVFSFQEQTERANYLAKVLKENGQRNFMTYFDHQTGLIALEMKTENHSKAITAESLDQFLFNKNGLDEDENDALYSLSSNDIALQVTINTGEIYDFEHSRGGNWLRDDGFRECTSGWSVSGPNGGGIITAGHCTGLNQFEESPNSIYSMTWRSQERKNGDVEYHTTSHVELAEFYYKPNNGKRDVNSIKWTLFMFPGSSVCEYGRSSNTRTCNHDVIATGVTATFSNGRTVNQLVKVSGDNSINGDSGGPWYWGTEAWGVHSGSNGSISLFTPVQTAQAELNVTIKTQ